MKEANLVEKEIELLVTARTLLTERRELLIEQREREAVVPDLPQPGMPWLKRWCIAAAAAHTWMMSAHPLL